MRRPLPITLAAVTMVVLAACGSAGVETRANSSTEAPLEAEASADDATGDAATATAPPAESPSTEAPADGATRSTAAPAAGGTTAPAPTPAPSESTESTQASTEALPDDGCSADNSPTATDVADGPPPAIEVRAASASNPLPDLAVRRVNCAGGWVNLKNEIPAARPLLVWFWAPH